MLVLLTCCVRASYTRGVECFRWNEQLPLNVEGSWGGVASMNVARYRCGGAVLNGKWFVIGGAQHDDGEVYDLGADRWVMMPRMNGGKRAGAGVTACDNRILVIGGFEGGALGTVEMFDPREGKWQFVDGYDWHPTCTWGCTRIDAPGVCTRTVREPPETLFQMDEIDLRRIAEFEHQSLCSDSGSDSDGSEFDVYGSDSDY